MENIKESTLEELEAERKRIHKKNKICGTIEILCILAGIGFFFLFFPLGIIFWVVAIAMVIITTSETKKFKAYFKERVVKKLIKSELGVEAEYRKNQGISIKEIDSLKVMSSPDRYHLEDYIACSYNGIPYEMCDCILEERRESHDSDGHTHTSYVAYFKGRVIKIDFQRDLNMELKVVNSPTQGFKHQGLVAFETEVTEFNKKFKIYASSKEEGFYLLTPWLIQKMLELEKLYKGGIYYVVMHNNLYVLINNSGDSLEINISKPLDEKQLDRIRSEILIGASIIHEFRMDTDKFNVNR